MLITRQNELDQFVKDLKAATASGSPLAFDTEFLSEKRYYARLCLVQVLAPRPDGNGVIEAAIDPFNLNLVPLIELIGDESIIKIVHSGSIDLNILWQNFGIAAKNVFDTQIAAAFLGFGHQIGYADLVRKVTAVNLSKTMQYTDWSVRPLSEEQIEYALADVRHLPPLLAHLKTELERRGRLEWAQTEFERAEAKAIRVQNDDDAYKRLNLSGFSRKQLAVLRETAKNREEMGRAIDKPPSFVVPDLALLQLARQQPKNMADLRSIRGMPGIPDSQGKRIIAAVQTALDSDPESWPKAQSTERPDPRLDSIVALLGVVAGARATAEDVSRNYLSPRDALWALASWWLNQKITGETAEPGEELTLLQDWRGEILGRDLLRLLDGEAVIALDPHTGLPELRSAANA